nr:acyl carrier protein [uncultured Rikenella sp.]
MRKKILEIMKRIFNVDHLPENPSQNNVEQWDSLRHLNLIIELEMEFNVEFEPEQIAQMKSLQEIEEILSLQK